MYIILTYLKCILFVEKISGSFTLSKSFLTNNFDRILFFFITPQLSASANILYFNVFLYFIHD